MNPGGIRRLAGLCLLVAVAVTKLLRPRLAAVAALALTLGIAVPAWGAAANVHRFYDFANSTTLAGMRAVSADLQPGDTVVADRCWRAKKGLDALKITWDPGAGKGLDDAGLREGWNGCLYDPREIHRRRRCAPDEDTSVLDLEIVGRRLQQRAS